jgi:hypothetical protein
MNRNVLRTIVAAALGVGLLSSPALAQLPLEVPALPSGLEVPAGNVLYLATRAEGTQNYICLPAGKKQVAWRFLGAQATLFEFAGTGEAPQQITTHYLSVNPVDALARPTWQHSVDSSRVWARLRTPSSDPNYVAPGAIPWLLLERAGVAVGPAGGGIMAQTTFIQRVNTAGGVAPSTGCSDDDHIGTVVLVPYATDYFFYRADQ